jgi:streptogramin lyase
MRVLAVVLALAVPAAVPARPQISGPRTTTSAYPVYHFYARGAVAFRCAFDGATLHPCRARYSEPLAPGRHVLRVRAVDRSGKLGPVGSIVTVVRAIPTLTGPRPTVVGRGPGVPAAGAGAVWVPNSLDGTVARVDPATRAVVATIPALTATPFDARAGDCTTFTSCGYLDAAAVVGSDVWVADDYGGEVVRIDSASNRVVTRIDVPPRPGGVAAGGGFVWLFHTRTGTVTRIDPVTAAAVTFDVPDAHGTGIAYAAGGVWLLTIDPIAVLRLDPQTGAVTARVLLEPFGVRHPFMPAWSLATDGRSLWAANPNYDMVTQVDAAAARVTNHIRLPRDQPFGVAVAGGDVWVAARTGVVRLDATRGTVKGELILPSTGSGYTSVAYGFGAAWVTSFDAGSLTRVTPYRA